MKLIALEIENANATAADFEPHLKNEARHVWELQQQGIIRELYFRADQHTAVLVLECESLSQAQKLISSFPLVQQGLIHFDIIPLIPYPGFSRLFV
jgi:muconolactone delta-isomerase